MMLTLRLWWRTVICLLLGHAWDDCYWPGRRVDYRFCDRCGECAKKERPPHVRDEAARVEANLTRQRDRRAEIRLETLLEVRQAWIDAPNVQRFGQWVQTEIDRITKADAA